MISNNPPTVVELDREMADFIVENCESNILLVLNAINTPGMSRQSLERLVELNEKFNKLRKLVMEARK